VELEVEAKGCDADTRAGDWRDAAEDWLICKHDGSLNKGFEIVTAPSDLPTHVQQWTTLLSDHALTDGLKSWDTSTCGMHVHVSRAPMSALTLGKILVFMNHPNTHTMMVKIAGRDANHYAAFTSKKVTDSVCKDANGKLCKSYGDGRYQVVNIGNTDTIEFRLFKGTLHVQHILANIEFCDAVVRWCMQNSIRDCDTWSTFWSYVTQHKKTYKHLIAYLEEK